MPVRTVCEHAYRIRVFRVRFHQADMMFQPAPEVRHVHAQSKQATCSGACRACLMLLHHMQVADEYLRGVLNAAAQESNTSDIPDLRALIRSGESHCALLDGRM